MSARVLSFPSRRDDHHGIVHVMGDQLVGFEIGHESASGNSWGSFSGPYSTGQEAIAAAYALNRDTYGSVCEVSVCDAASQDRRPSADAPSSSGDF